MWEHDTIHMNRHLDIMITTKINADTAISLIIHVVTFPNIKPILTPIGHRN